jgi:tetratricopeptide (TPR) repeat protein
LFLAWSLAFGSAAATAQDGATPEPPSEPGREATSGPAPAAGTPAASHPGELFVHANSAYEAGDYPRAIELYRALVERGHDNGHLHYNLGNAYLRNGELGRAVASYRESLADLPRDQDVAANLSFARRSTKDALTPPEPSPWLRTLVPWHYELSRRELTWTVLALNLLFWCALAGLLFRRRWASLSWTALGLLLLLLATGGSLLVRHLWPTRVAVVLPQEIDAVSGPGSDAVVRFKLHAGTEVEVEGEREGWVRIALPDGQQGWVAEDQVAVVRW